METIKLTIPNMKSPHCQMTVTNAVRASGGIMRSVGPTKAEIELRDGITKGAIVKAIENAGYHVISGL
jgi:copper chaperone CopZ